MHTELTQHHLKYYKLRLLLTPDQEMSLPHTVDIVSVCISLGVLCSE
jgi:hypothetical protein